MSSFKILEQPQTRGHRFRYDTEKREGGNLLGVNADKEHRKSYPKVLLETKEKSDQHYVLISCVEAEPYSYVGQEPQYRIHPCLVTGKNHKDGICKISFDKNTSIAHLKSIGIQIVSKKLVSSSVENQLKSGLDFYGLGKGKGEPYDMKKLRLAFQVHVFEEKASTYITLPPKVSNVIIDQRFDDPLMIHVININQAPVEGGATIMAFTSKINKTEINVAFQDEQGQELTHIKVENINIFGQNGLCFETPKVQNGGKTKLFLWRQNKEQIEKSNLVDFEFVNTLVNTKQPDDEVLAPKKSTKRSISTNTDTEGEQQPAASKRRKILFDQNSTTAADGVQPNVSDENMMLKLRDLELAFQTVIETCQQSLTDVNYLLDLITKK